MSVFTETIKLEDKVSPAAKAAAGQAKALGSAMSSVQSQMIKAEAIGGTMSKAYLQLSKQSSLLATSLGKVDQGLLKEVAAAKAADTANAALSKATKQAEKDKADAVKASTDKQIADQTKMSNILSVARDAVGSAVQGMKSALTSLASGDVKGAVQGVTDSVAGMSKMLDLVVPGLGQAVSAVIQIAGGLVGITAGLILSGAKFAIQSSQAKVQMLAMFDALGAGKISGEEVDGMLDGLSSKLGITKDAMVPLVQKFAAMGVTSKDALEKMTTAALSAKALAGGADSGAEAFASLSKKIQLASQTGQGLQLPIKGLGQLAAMGITVDDVSKRMGVSSKVLGEQLKKGTANASKFGTALQDALIKKGAGPLRAMSLGAANLSAMFHQYIGDLFEDLGKDVEPFMAAVKDLFSIFDSKSQPSGAVLKAGIGGFFKEVFALATKVVPMIKHFLLDVIILGLKAYIALKPIVKDFFGKLSVEAGKARDLVTQFAMGLQPVIGWIEKLAQNQSVVDAFWSALKGIGTVIAVVVVVFVAVVAVAAMVVGALLAIQIGIVAVGGYILDMVLGAGTALSKWIAGAATAAYDFVAGLVAGISNGAGAVIGAVKGLAGSATGAFKSALGIHSPSKVMMGLGGHIASGAAEGIEAGSNDVHGAASGMAGAAVKGATSGASPGGGGGKGTTINVEIQIDGAGKSAIEITETMVSQVFQRMALEAGI